MNMDVTTFQEETMDARKWIEFGKMFNNLEVAGIEVELLCSEIGDYYISTFDTNNGCCLDNEGVVFCTPYLAMKDYYFNYFCNTGDYTNTLVYIADQDLTDLYKESDVAGMPVEEYVLQILKNTELPDPPKPIEIHEAYCCYNCIHLTLFPGLDECIAVKCNKHGINTLYENTCKDYFPRTENK